MDLPALYHTLVKIQYGSNSMRLKILQGSSTAAIVTAIRNRFGIADEEPLVLVDQEGNDVIIDHTLETGDYRLQTKASPAESKEESKEEGDDIVLGDESGETSTEVFSQPKSIVAGARLKNLDQYRELYERSLKDSDGFWKEMGNKYVTWFTPFTKVQEGGFAKGDIKWFLGGKLNVSYNCIDRHLPKRANKVALLWESDDPREVRKITYQQLYEEVGRLANALKALGVKKGDTVCIYMPMVPELAFAMLACTRIGAPHSVVFAGFSADSLRDRIIDGHCRFILTADEGLRAGKVTPLKVTVDKAIQECQEAKWEVKQVLVYRRTGATIPFVKGRDQWYHELVPSQKSECKPEILDSEHPLFMLFTSGSTGKPKGIQHTSGGYLVYTAFTHEYVFDLREDDIFACVADCGWITGHSYIVYGPLANGATSFMFESVPLYPDAGRYWECVQRHKISLFYTAPTAIRSLMKFGERFVKKFDRSSLRILGSVGEPINPEAWKWYHNVVGDGKCTIVDTFWQTETGGHVITPLPGATPLKPGAAMTPFFGIEVALLDPVSGKEVIGNGKKGVLCFKRPWPGIARTIYGDHERYMKTYLTHFANHYFTGDGCKRDKDGFYWITGRVDDVVNVSGHRIGSAEIEHALVSHLSVAEAAVIGVPHEIKGQSLFAYVTPKMGVNVTDKFIEELKEVVKVQVGSFAKPDDIVVAHALPKTRSGKIIRRLLRKIACNEIENLGDITTLENMKVVEDLVSAVKELRSKTK